MEEFIEPQIREGCKLVLPEGLQDLMSDISREVLRAQPANLCKFIADYLSALMVAREHLSIAAHLCDDLCKDACNPELEDELRYIGLDKIEAGNVKKVVTEYFEKGEVKEQNLMIKIAKRISGDSASLLPAIQEAIRKAFKRHLVNTTTIYQSSSDSDLDEVTRAAKNTLRLYRKTRHSPEEYNRAAEKVQAAYRAYGVRRPGPRDLGQEAMPRQKPQERNLRYSATKSQNESSVLYKGCMPTASSTSLAGSYMHLPKYVPYSIHHPEEGEDETENASIYYSNEEYSASGGHRKISFQDTPNEILEDNAVLADDESDMSVEEMLQDKKTTPDDNCAYNHFDNEDLDTE